MSEKTTTYRVRGTAEHNMVVWEVPCAFSTFENVIIIRLKEHVREYQLETLRRVKDELWPDRTLLILPPGVEFVQLIENAS